MDKEETLVSRDAGENKHTDEDIVIKILLVLTRDGLLCISRSLAMQIFSLLRIDALRDHFHVSGWQGWGKDVIAFHFCQVGLQLRHTLSFEFAMGNFPEHGFWRRGFLEKSEELPRSACLPKYLA